MIITRTPLRITLGGGGTDLPSYYRRSGGGFVVAAAINKYVYIAINRNFDDDILLKYSQVERAEAPEEIRHPLLRECLFASGTRSGIEISSMADIPAGTGLGSSGAFTVGVLKALAAFERRLQPPADLAAEACHIEIENLGEPVGKQDQYIAAFGGITALDFNPDDTVGVRRLVLPEDSEGRLDENLLLFYTGTRRSASETLRTQQTRTEANDTAVTANLDTVRAIGEQSADALERGDLDRFAELMTEQWDLKRSRHPSPTHDRIDELIRRAIKAGAAGGKLVGAGNGGFILVYAEPKADVRRALADHGLEEVRFSFDHQGCAVVVS